MTRIARITAGLSYDAYKRIDSQTINNLEDLDALCSGKVTDEQQIIIDLFNADGALVIQYAWTDYMKAIGRA